ncbi:FKBP-type peptidyl-prolyl cis-trans isomerase [Sphingobacterium bovistauri]|uniref:Peptidyl-prolyl cis-trans isomerase n=1 Tax=Sphingobacterium bovistauri TaxID=2781959 RepID=A0ABS7Z132_9SPHI|nr:FKBP-type peptidyl-prolyl cis-trans isomerase [Sphingobacterium bovistauri]MCA5003877.1 FKBP-type peptidyl-prolyl cis-trans isomerase [Sphingobacterium bovistauri]
MKYLFSILSVAALLATTFTACNKSDDFDYEEYYKQQEQAVDSLLSAEKLKIENYVDEHFDNPIEDTVSIKYSYLSKKTAKRGIWYEILSQPTDNTYEYKATSSQQLTVPTLKLKYTAKLLNGTVVQSDLQGGQYSFSSNSNNLFNQAWHFAFFPYTVKFNAIDVKIHGLGGLTKDGLKKGSKIRVITPSLWAFGGTKVGDIPANSPLVYEFEVLEIQ